MSARVPIMAALLCLSTLAFAREEPQDSARGVPATLRIRTNVDSAYVHLDGIRIGRTPLAIDTVQAGVHFLRILPPDSASWLFDGISDTLHLRAGERKELAYVLSYRLLINSLPSGASVYCRDSALGTTPLLLKLEQALRSPTLVIRKAGYEEVTLSTSAVRGGSVIVPLVQAQGSAGNLVRALKGDEGAHRSWLPVYVSGGGALLAGGLAAAWKIAAEEKDIAYRASGDPSLARQRNHLDRASALATAAMEICVVYFIYRLLSE
jgi:hypothetical protein